MKKRNHLLPVLMILLASWIGFFLMENRIPFAETSDARYCEIAWETWQYNDWLIPRQNRMAHITKPPLTYWLVAAGYSLFGVNEVGARFFSGVFGTLLALLAYAISFIISKSRRTALTAGLVTTATPLVISSARIVTTDIFMVTFMTLSMAAWLRYLEKPGSSARWMFWLSLGLSGMAKGPVGPFLVFAVLIIHTGMSQRIAQLRDLFAPLPVLTGLLLIFWWPIVIFMTVEGSFHYLVIGQLLSRVKSTGFGHPHPLWYFAAWFPAVVLPWTPLLAVGIIQAWRSRTDHDRFLLIWLLFPIVFFSVPANKLILYILPAAIPAAILTARAAFTVTGRSWYPVWAVMIAAFAAAFPSAARLGPLETLTAWHISMALLTGAAVTALGRRYPMAGVIGMTGSTLAAMLAIIHLLGQAPETYINTAKTVSARINAISAKRPVTLFNDGFINRSLTLYTGLHPFENEVDREALPAEKAASRLIVPYGEMADFIRQHPDTILVRRTRDQRPLPLPMIRIFPGSRYSLFVPKPVSTTTP